MDPLGILSGKFLEEGIKFLWNQAGEIVKRYHEKKDSDKKKPVKVKEKKKHKVQKEEQLERLESEVPSFLAFPASRRIDFERVEERLDELKHLYKELSPFALGIEKIPGPEGSDGTEKRVQLYADALQQLLLYICSEKPSCPRVDIFQELKNVDSSGKVQAGKIDRVKKGDVRITQIVHEDVSGELIGPKIKEIG